MTQAKPRPEGQHTIIPHLVIRDAAQAIDFYKKAFGAVEQMRMPMPDGKIMHACLKIGDSSFFMADECPDMGGNKSPLALGGTPITLNLNVDDADAVFARAVAAGAKVKMPLADMFWGDRYGIVVDPFGHQWAVATHKEDVAPEEMKKRGQAMFAKMEKEKH
jgi:PhnB protein